MSTDLFLAWKEAYSVGNEQLDSQHKGMVDLIMKLHRALEDGASEGEVKQLIGRACDYAKEHFETEEGLLEGCGYPGIEEHKRSHGSYLSRVEAIRLNADVALEKMAYELFFYLKDWWLDHITKMDLEYRPFLHSTRSGLWRE